MTDSFPSTSLLLGTEMSTMFTSKLLTLDSSSHLNEYKRNLGTHRKSNARPPFDNSELHEQVGTLGVFPVPGEQSEEVSHRKHSAISPPKVHNRQAVNGRTTLGAPIALQPQPQIKPPNHLEAMLPPAIVTALQGCAAIHSTTSPINSILDPCVPGYTVHQRNRMPGKQSVHTVVGTYETARRANERAVERFMEGGEWAQGVVDIVVLSEGLMMCGFEDERGREMSWWVVREEK
ncbi:hypothetical protein BDU57DRAFT_520071 [Ampelomyces quisqualis]|uniref:Uncharacterized protein n=1 Tax=Ampelomyces quisqualis TaxID=50730 RepID=A0A6A5QJL2_AMPQU|nr:hypothetical protein BDU57DRAFT_520071 [Ampelomyces quisqualis]